MAEWSKAVDLSSILLWRRGFEPHSRHFFAMYKFLSILYLYEVSLLPVILVGVVGNISACHADARGSIPRLGVFIFGIEV